MKFPLPRKEFFSLGIGLICYALCLNFALHKAIAASTYVEDKRTQAYAIVVFLILFFPIIFKPLLVVCFEMVYGHSFTIFGEGIRQKFALSVRQTASISPLVGLDKRMVLLFALRGKTIKSRVSIRSFSLYSVKDGLPPTYEVTLYGQDEGEQVEIHKSTLKGHYKAKNNELYYDSGVSWHEVEIPIKQDFSSYRFKIIVIDDGVSELIDKSSLVEVEIKINIALQAKDLSASRQVALSKAHVEFEDYEVEK